MPLYVLLRLAQTITPGNKTLQFYATEALRFLRKLHLTTEWQTVPQNQHTLEKCAALMMQWHRPKMEVYWNKFSKKLDEIAEEVKEQLKIICPNHPLFAVSKEKLKIWRDANIRSNKFGDLQCRQILETLENFCSRPGFRCAMKEFLETMRDQYAVNIILLIARESVARSLGLKGQLATEVDTGYYLQWSQKYSVKEDDSYETEMNVLDNSLAGDSPIPPDFLRRLALNLQEPGDCFGAARTNACSFTRLYSVCELLLLIDSYDAFMLDHLAALAMEVKIDCTSLIESFKQKIGQVSGPEGLQCVINVLTKYQATRALDGDLPKKVKAKVRPSNLKYAVGMVMIYQCHEECMPHDICVICDWNPDRLTPDGHPVYNVLLPVGLYKDISEGNLKPADIKATLLRVHLLDEIGRHFSHAYKTHFVPNAEKEREYPDDAAVRFMYSQKMKADVSGLKLQ